MTGGAHHALEPNEPTERLRPKADGVPKTPLELTGAESTECHQRVDTHWLARSERRAHASVHPWVTRTPGARQLPAEGCVDDAGFGAEWRFLQPVQERPVQRNSRLIECWRGVPKFRGRRGQERQRAARLEPDADEPDRSRRRDRHVPRRRPDEQRSWLALRETTRIVPLERCPQVDHHLDAPVRQYALGWGTLHRAGAQHPVAPDVAVEWRARSNLAVVHRGRPCSEVRTALHDRATARADQLAVPPGHAIRAAYLATVRFRPGPLGCSI